MVVAGQEGSGKSSVLERIAMRSIFSGSLEMTSRPQVIGVAMLHLYTLSVCYRSRKGKDVRF